MGHHLKGHHGKTNANGGFNKVIGRRRLGGCRKKLYDNREKLKSY